MSPALTFPPVVTVGQGGYTSGVIDANLNWTPETGSRDVGMNGADLPADLLGINTTQNVGRPYPTNSWLSQIMRPPANEPQGSFYSLPLGFQPMGRAGVQGLNIMGPGDYSTQGNLNPGRQTTVSIFAFSVISGITPDMSRQIFNALQDQKFINSGVLSFQFDPQQPGFSLNLTGQFAQYEPAIIEVLQFYQTVVPQHAFVSTAAAIDASLSVQIWNTLKQHSLIDANGVFQGGYQPYQSMNLPGLNSGQNQAVVQTLGQIYNQTLVNFLYHPAAQTYWQTDGNTWLLSVAGANQAASANQPVQQLSRWLVDRHDPWSADLIAPVNWTPAQAGQPLSAATPSVKLTAVRGSPCAFFTLNQVDIEFFVLAKVGSPSLIYSQHDPAAAGHFPQLHYFGLLLDGQCWGFFQPTGSTFAFSPVPQPTPPPLNPAALPGNFVIATQTSQQHERFCTLALLPPPDATHTAQQWLDLFAQRYAYNVVTETMLDWEVNDSYQVTTTFGATLVNKDPTSTVVTTPLGLLPHHLADNALHLVNGQPFDPASVVTTYPQGPRGAITTVEGQNFTTQYQFSGVLPWLPSGFGTGGQGDATALQAYLSNYQQLQGEHGLPPWTEGMWSTVTDQSLTYYPFGPKDTYGAGKQFNKLIGYCIAAQAAGQTPIFQSAFAALKSYLIEWLTPATSCPQEYRPASVPWTEGQYPFYYFAYDSAYTSLLGYPGSFGSTTSLNDHHFHYGYFLHAAAYIALNDPDGAAFVNDYGGMIDLLTADIANTPDIQQQVVATAVPTNTPQFPTLRYWDFYEAHSWATGYQKVSGPGAQEEASSEAMNAWSGMVLWGAAANRPAIAKAGVYLCASHVASLEAYHFNIAATFTVSNQAVTFQEYGNFVKDFVDFSGQVPDQVRQAMQSDPTQPYYVPAQTSSWMSAVRIFAAGYTSDTDWEQYPSYRYTINWLPMTGSSLYLGRHPGYVQASFLQMQQAALAESTPTPLTGYPMYKPTAGDYWQQELGSPYAWATISLPFLALATGNTPFTFVGGTSATVLGIFTQWYAQAEQQALKIYQVPSYIPDFQAQAVAFQESGSTVADAYTMIAALATFGTPVFAYTPSYPTGTAFGQSATPLFAVFQQPGVAERTFAVYNASAATFPVTFKDASGATVITVQAQPHALTTQTG